MVRPDGLYGVKTEFAIRMFPKTRQELLDELFAAEQKVIDLRLKLEELEESNA